MNSPKRTAEVLVSGNIDPQLSPSQIISLHQIMHPTISSPERSQLFQESKLWHLGEHNKDTTAADITLATWQKKSKPATRIMADALKKQAFPRRPTSSTTSKRRKRKKKKKVPKQQAWSTRQPRGDLMKGLDGLTEAEAMKAWKESMGPQSFRLGKAKAAIQLYQKCLTIKPDYIDCLNNLSTSYLKLGDKKNSSIVMKKTRVLLDTTNEKVFEFGEHFADELLLKVSAI